MEKSKPSMSEKAVLWSKKVKKSSGIDFDTLVSFIANNQSSLQSCLSSLSHTFQEISVHTSYTGQVSLDFFRLVKEDLLDCASISPKLQSSLHHSLERKLIPRFEMFLSMGSDSAIQWFHITWKNTDQEPNIEFDSVEDFETPSELQLPLVLDARGCLSAGPDMVWDLIIMGTVANVKFQDESALEYLRENFLLSFGLSDVVSPNLSPVKSSKKGEDSPPGRGGGADERHRGGEEGREEGAGSQSLQSSPALHGSLSQRRIVDEIVKGDGVDALDAVRSASDRLQAAPVEPAFLFQVIQKITLFQTYCEAELLQIVTGFTGVVVDSAETIIKQGTRGRYFYIIQHGSVDIFLESDNGRKSTKKRTLVAGDYFGELALIYDVPRSATIIASEQSILWRIDQATVLAKVLDAVLPDDEATEKWDLVDGF